MSKNPITRWSLILAAALVAGAITGWVTWLAGYSWAESMVNGEAGLGTAILFAYFIAPGIGLATAVALAVILARRTATTRTPPPKT